MDGLLAMCSPPKEYDLKCCFPAQEAHVTASESKAFHSSKNGDIPDGSDCFAGSSQRPEEGLRVHLEAAGVRVAEDAFICS